MWKILEEICQAMVSKDKLTGDAQGKKRRLSQGEWGGSSKKRLKSEINAAQSGKTKAQGAYQNAALRLTDMVEVMVLEKSHLEALKKVDEDYGWSGTIYLPADADTSLVKAVKSFSRESGSTYILDSAAKGPVNENPAHKDSVKSFARKSGSSLTLDSAAKGPAHKGSMKSFARESGSTYILDSAAQGLVSENTAYKDSVKSFARKSGSSLTLDSGAKGPVNENPAHKDSVKSFARKSGSFTLDSAAKGPAHVGSVKSSTRKSGSTFTMNSAAKGPDEGPADLTAKLEARRGTFGGTAAKKPFHKK